MCIPKLLLPTLGSSSSTTKLVPHLGGRRRYVLHIELLVYYLQKNMKLIELHRAIRFDQSNWLKVWIDHNMELRKTARTDFEKDFFKLANNAVFGKSMEDTSRYVNSFVARDRATFIKKTSQPHYDSCMTFGDKSFAIALMKKRQAILDRPLNVRATTMEFAKLYMYRFHYDVMVPLFGRESISMMMTDTDSLLYKIFCDDLDAKLKTIIDRLDTSGYPEEHALFSESNKKVVGKFKDETNGLTIRAFEANGVKNYAFVYGDGVEVKHLKGVNKGTQKYMLSFADWRAQRDAAEPLYVQCTSLRAVSHTLYTITADRVALSRCDTKRFWLADGSSLPLGHFKTRDKT